MYILGNMMTTYISCKQSFLGHLGCSVNFG